MTEASYKPSRDELYRLYVSENKSIEEVSKSLNISVKRARNFLSYAGIPHRDVNVRQNQKKPSAEDLRRMYIDEHLTVENIAKNLQITQTTLYSWFADYRIPLRGWISRKDQGAYSRKNLRRDKFLELLSRSGQTMETVRPVDFYNTRSENGKRYISLLVWYQKKHNLGRNQALEKMIEDLSQTDAEGKKDSQRSSRILKMRLKDWRVLKSELQKIFTAHPELNGKLPSQKWLSDHSYHYIYRAIYQYYNGFHEIRNKLKERTKNDYGYWKDMGVVSGHILDIVKSNKNLNGNMPSRKWLIKFGYKGLVNGIERHHGGFPAFREKMAQLSDQGNVRSLRQIKKNSWKDLEFTLEQASSFLKNHSEFQALPQASVLKKYDDGKNLISPIRTYHGGFPAFREKLREYIGQPTEKNQLENLLKGFIQEVKEN